MWAEWTWQFYRWKVQFLGLGNIDSISISRKGMSVHDLEALGKLNSSVCLVYGHYKVEML